MKTFNVVTLATGVLLASLVGACALAGAQPQREPPGMSGGQRIAERNCGGCHAVASGASPLADAPPFRALHDRYPPGGLDVILQEGMLRPSRMPEEGSPRFHPRMPMADLDDDEVAQLKAYLRSLDPRAPAIQPSGR
jgi:mono/diheme cytochrome c family protein